MKVTAILITIFTISMLVSACSTMDNATHSTDIYGERKVNKTTKGAGIGAATGAVIGAAVSHNNRGKGALIGAVAGGLVGGGVGAYMDNKEAELNRQLAGTGVKVRRQGDQIILIMPGQISFNSSSAELNPSIYNALNGVALVLKNEQQINININGHTDSTGNYQMNQNLSISRAQAVANYLGSVGIPTNRMQTFGYGPSQPVADNGTAQGRALNRRVELIITVQQ